MNVCAPVSMEKPAERFPDATLPTSTFALASLTKRNPQPSRLLPIPQLEAVFVSKRLFVPSMRKPLSHLPLAVFSRKILPFADEATWKPYPTPTPPVPPFARLRVMVLVSPLI
jgi:hypothetical protein